MCFVASPRPLQEPGTRIFSPDDLVLLKSTVTPPADALVMPLIAHCQFCYAAGGPFSTRPVCPTCKCVEPPTESICFHHVVVMILSVACVCWHSTESVMIVNGEIRSGRSTFRSLLGLKIECLSPDCTSRGAIQPVSLSGSIEACSSH